MDNIILGLLLLSDRTIYQLRERINKGLNLMYSSSTGSIQAALKKLLRYGYISYSEVIEDGKYKKIYSITEIGKEHFFDWINAPMDKVNIKNPELVKVYFMGFSDKECRVKNIEKHLEILNGQYKVLCDICQEGDNTEVLEKYQELFKYQLITAQYGRDILKFNIDWYGKLLEQMRGEER